MSVVSPPVYENEAGPAPEPTKRSNTARILAAVGAVALVGVVGFVAGRGTAPEASVVSDGSAPDDVAAVSTKRETARSVLERSLLVGNEVLATINPTQLETDVATYQSNPAAWDEQYLSATNMEALLAYKEESEEGDSARRLGASRRSLIGSYNEALVDAAYEKFESENFQGAINVGSDQFKLRVEGNTCWFIASTSDEGADWASNLQTGSRDILAVTQSGSSYRSLGRGYRGFVDTYNAGRLQMKNALVASCSGKNINMVGYSRGAGLLSPLAYALVVDGVFPANKVTLVTFGSPRVFEDSVSDKAHNLFTHWRMVHKSDIVTSIPYDWWGYKHFGTMRCMNCNYSEGRDRPFFAADIGAHTSYCTVFGNNVCK